jgi:hypothetical protein
MIMKQANVCSESRALRVSVSFIKYAAALAALLLVVSSPARGQDRTFTYFDFSLAGYDGYAQINVNGSSGSFVYTASGDSYDPSLGDLDNPSQIDLGIGLDTVSSITFGLGFNNLTGSVPVGVDTTLTGLDGPLYIHWVMADTHAETGGYSASGVILRSATDTDWHDNYFMNPENPYDYIGLIHNHGLDYVAARLSLISHDSLYPSTDTMAVLYGDSAFGYFSGGLDTDDSLSSHLHIMRAALTHEDSLLDAPYPWSDDAQSDISAILNIASSELTPDDAIDSVLSIESAVLSPISGLSGKDQEVVLRIAVCARYSIAYWSSVDTSMWPDKADHVPHRAVVYYSSNQKKRSSDTPQWTWSGYFGVDAIAAVTTAGMTWPVGTVFPPAWGAIVAIAFLGGSAGYSWASGR